MKGALVARIAAGALIVSMMGPAYAQAPPLLPGEVQPQRETEDAEQLPEPPPDQFSACVGITELERREACIERETEKRNPATESVPESSESPQEPAPELPR